MPTNYPTALDAFTNPDGATDDLDSPGVNHDDQHTDANDAIEALEAKVGIVSSAVTTSLDYLVNHLGGDLSGTLANAQLVASAVGTTELAALAVTDAKVATANKDGSAATPSMRTLGTGAAQAVAGNDARLSDARTPTTHSDSVHSVDYATQAELDTHAGAADPHAVYVRESLIDAPGDLIVGTAADTVGRKAVGADGTMLVAEGAQSDDLVWRAPVPSKAYATSSLTLSTTITDIAGATVAVTLARANQPVTVEGTFDFNMAATGATAIGALDVDGVEQTEQAICNPAIAAGRATVGQGWQLMTLGSGSRTLKLRAKKSAAGGTITADAPHTGLRVIVWP